MVAMFSFRKRKREAEDEPLVPHGLVWQATDTPEEQPQTEPPKESISKGSPPPPEGKPQQELRQPPGPLELPLKANPDIATASGTTLPRREPVAAVNRIGAISPPKAWPSPRVQELTRRAQNEPADEGVAAPRLPIDAMHLRDAEGPVVNQAKAHSDDIAAPELLTPAPTPDIEPVSAKVQSADITEPAPRKPIFSDTFALIRQELRDARSIVGQEFRELRLKAGESFRALRLKQKLGHGRDFVVRRTADARTGFASLSDQAKERSGAWRDAASVSAKQNLNRSSLAISERFARTREIASQAWNHHPVRIRIRGMGIGKARMAVTGLNQRFKLSGLTANRDSRLWTSMAMAALSALLALAVITGVRGYVPVERGSNPNPPATSLSSEQTVTPAPAVSHRTHSHLAKSPPAVHVASKPVAPLTQAASVKKTVVAPEPIRRRRLTADEDYVAKDTYVVYGANGKPIRR